MMGANIWGLWSLPMEEKGWPECSVSYVRGCMVDVYIVVMLNCYLLEASLGSVVAKVCGDDDAGE